jgi:hypothetical protein
MTDARALTLSLRGKWYGRYGCAPCPVCQQDGRKAQNALTLADGNGGKLLLNCKKAGCDYRDIATAAGITQDTYTPPDPTIIAQRAAEQRKNDAKRAQQARRLWTTCKPLTGTKGEAYLRGRGIICPLPPSLGWAVDAFHGPSARYLSAMVGDVSTGGVHRTYFEKSGARIGGNAKMMQGPCAGGAVALSEAQGPLVVCEGIETGLSLLSGLLASPATVWAALSTSGMKSLALPSAPDELIVGPYHFGPRLLGKIGTMFCVRGWQLEHSKTHSL